MCTDEMSNFLDSIKSGAGACTPSAAMRRQPRIIQCLGRCAGQQRKEGGLGRKADSE